MGRGLSPRPASSGRGGRGQAPAQRRGGGGRRPVTTTHSPPPRPAPRAERPRHSGGHRLGKGRALPCRAARMRPAAPSPASPQCGAAGAAGAAVAMGPPRRSPALGPGLGLLLALSWLGGTRAEGEERALPSSRPAAAGKRPGAGHAERPRPPVPGSSREEGSGSRSPPRPRGRCWAEGGCRGLRGRGEAVGRRGGTASGGGGSSGVRGRLRGGSGGGGKASGVLASALAAAGSAPRFEVYVSFVVW